MLSILRVCPPMQRGGAGALTKQTGKRGKIAASHASRMFKEEQYGHV